MVSILAVLISAFWSERSQEEYSPYNLMLPPKIHDVIDEDATTNKRVLIVGDVHGCLDELKELLSIAGGYDGNTCIIFVGDLTNKGPKSAEVVRFVRQLGAYSVRGNHDEVSLLEYEKGFFTTRRGDFHWVEELSDDDLQFLYTLPYTLRIPTLNAIVVHAGLVPGKPLRQQRLIDMIELRNVIKDQSDKLSFIGTKNIDEGTPWAQSWFGPMHIYFGHDARRRLQQCHFATGLDTGCCYGGSLTAVLIDTDGSKKFFSVKAKEVHRDPRQRTPDR